MSIRETPFGSRALSVEPRLEPGQERDGRALALEPAQAPARPWTFDSMYQTYAPFVWRNACRLGVPNSAVEDVMQEVFLVVYRRLPDFEERTSVRAWLSAILIRVVRAHRRAQKRRSVPQERETPPLEPDRIPDSSARSPLEAAERDEAVRELYAILESMNEERREVLVLSEIEQLTAPEIAHALNVNVNTIYWRLRTARREFERILFRRRKTAEAPGAR